MFKNIIKDRGSVTIEATLSLSAFMFAIVTILTIVNICIVQAKVAYAINTTAKEISQYSYIYSLTGLNDSQDDIYDAGIEATSSVDDLLSTLNEVYAQIENIPNALSSSGSGNTGETGYDVESVLNAWDSVAGNIENIENAGSAIYEQFESIASNPKDVIFGIAKLAASESFDLAKSRLIAAPLAKVMVQKHLVNKTDGDVNSYLDALGVVPSANGIYLDGLDFTKSELFANGSSVIKINVEYDVEIIPLLPIDFSFHFNQTAITHGWLSGEKTLRTGDTYVENNTLWTQATIDERTNYINNSVIDEMVQDGYYETSGLKYAQLYNKDKNEFAMVSSMNPLWTPQGEEPKTVDDLDEDAIKQSLELLCGEFKSSTSGINTVDTKKEIDGTTIKEAHNCSGATNKIILVIPQDAGLKEKMEAIIAQANTNGVTIEVVQNYGNGA